ncbi:hypothetical protein HU675_0038515 [Bradyrhizobium septentrionale]|uniref:hypothetical protein n=1 Tax=Bradyrhizobium septentrionale TaxID=1404411 RepID=UPI0015969804|nr:hypothetical protein [Bradyrhizobium septentrionale]UGY23781.1 hypothetical protein HU675_0038515 [Bradyrhizobium septentrionale]
MLEQLMREDDLPGPLSLEESMKQLTSEEAFKIGKWMDEAESISKDFECTAALERIAIIRKSLARGMTHRVLCVELRVLRETIDSGLNNQLIYRYPAEKARVFGNWKSDWEKVIVAFPSAKKDILECVDLWAMAHPTASVFHAMRILEHGLRALAKHVGKTFDIQNWQNIIDEIESGIRDRAKKMPRGSDKNEKLKFLSEAAKEFTYFKDGWRNYVSHNRSDYDEHQARSVYEHVRTFMTVLSSQMGEVTTR